MAFNLQSITKTTVHRPCRMILLGVEKIGKSTFAAGADDVVFIPVKREEGIDSLDVAKFPPVNTFDELMEALQTLGTDDHTFKNVVIDSASALEPVVWDSVCSDKEVTSIEAIGYGKGFHFALEKWFELMDALDYLREEKGMGSIIIGHVKIKRFDDPERESYDAYHMDIKDNVAAALYRWADFTGFANKSVAIKKETSGFKKERKIAELTDDGQPFLYTKKTPAHPGGGRDVYGRLPDEIPLDYKSFKEAVAELTKTPSKVKKTKE